MLEGSVSHFLILLIFIIGYLAIIFEHVIRVNKTASALLMAVLTWMFLFLTKGHSSSEYVTALGEHLNNISQIIFFLLGAMALVELIDSHKGFKIITDFIQTGSKRKLLWIMGFTAFFLSALLDNLTTTIVMVSLIRKLISDPKERLLIGSMIVIAANAGGAWTPIGDVTTTMLWIHGNITTLNIMKTLFLPSFASLLFTLGFLSWNMKGKHGQLVKRAHEEHAEPGARVVFFCGVGGLLFVPLFKTFTGLPPFMGMLIVLGLLWLLTDLMHHKHEQRQHLRIPYILTRVDASGVLFFLGILLAVSSLDALGALRDVSEFLNEHVKNHALIATAIGLISSVIDNVPLVAASMGMYDLQMYPPDSRLWEMIAYCAGTGGSILIIGSAAGVALMGLEKVDFIWYFKRMSFVALLSYLLGMGVYLLQELLVPYFFT